MVIAKTGIFGGGKILPNFLSSVITAVGVKNSVFDKREKGDFGQKNSLDFLAHCGII